MFTQRLPLFLITVSLLTVMGCRDAKITSYRVRKEAPPRVPVSVGEGPIPTLHFKAPEGWNEQPAGTVRVASFAITSADGRKADMSVTQFPGDVGGDLANVNRWRGQIELAPLSESELPNEVHAHDLPAGSFSVIEMASERLVIDGKYRSRILGAWLKQPDRTWFFKLSGESELVDAQKKAFEDFLNSVEIVTPAPAENAPEVPAGSTPDGSPISKGPARAVTWTAPGNWNAKPLGAMRKGSYTLQGMDGVEADLSIISFPGEAGGIAENLNRWRGQIQLPKLDPAALARESSTLANDGLRFTIVDYTGTSANGPTRLLGAILPLENETYFFKLIGADAVVNQHKQSFLDFLKTVKAR